jgi:hypothetical protein
MGAPAPSFPVPNDNRLKVGEAGVALAGEACGFVDVSFSCLGLADDMFAKACFRLAVGLYRRINEDDWRRGSYLSVTP